MKRLLVPLVVAAASAAVIAAAASSTGSGPAQLVRAGWTCIVPPGDVVHCLPPGTSVRQPGSPSLSLRVFGGTDPNAEDAPFLGTEHLIRVDLYRGQPCPQDPPSRRYTDLRPILGLPYFACHHYDSPF